MNTKFLRAITALFAVTLISSVAVAQPERPWAKGVSEADQKAAFKLFDEANTAFGARSYGEALKTYKAALAHWDHPMIRYNMAECFIHLDQPEEAFKSIQKALEYGVAALGEDVHNRALTRQKLLVGQIAYLEVVNDESGAQVTINGDPLLAQVGKVRKVLRPGRYQIVAKKDGRLTQTEEVTLLPGETRELKVRLLEVGAVPLVRRWATWKPWVVLGSGVLVGVGGGVLAFRARQNMDRFDDFVANDPTCANGCPESEIPANIRDSKDTAELQDVIGLSMIGTGVAVAATGVALLILNQPRRAEVPPPGVAVVPVLDPDNTGFAVRVSY